MAPPGQRDSRSEGGVADGGAAWGSSVCVSVNNTTGPAVEQTPGVQRSHRLALLAALLITGEALGKLRAGVPRVRLAAQKRSRDLWRRVSNRGCERTGSTRGSTLR